MFVYIYYVSFVISLFFKIFEKYKACMSNIDNKNVIHKHTRTHTLCRCQVQRKNSYICKVPFV